jgi:hypothetical protein
MSMIDLAAMAVARRSCSDIAALHSSSSLVLRAFKIADTYQTQKAGGSWRPLPAGV